MNARRGYVTFQADGKDYALRFGANQMAAAEDVLGLPFGQIIDKLNDPTGKTVRFGDLRALFAVAVGMKPEEAGDIMDAVGIAKASELLCDTIKAAFPDAAEDDAGNGGSQKQT